MSQTVQQLVDAAKARIREIGPHDLASLLRSASVPVIDVREPDEFEDGHLPGAVNIPRGLLEFEVDGHPAVAYHREEALSHRERPLLLYCLSGGRSALAAEALQRLGFVLPMSLEGGFLAWADAGHPIVSPSGEWQSNPGTGPLPRVARRIGAASGKMPGLEQSAGR